MQGVILIELGRMFGENTAAFMYKEVYIKKYV